MSSTRTRQDNVDAEASMQAENPFGGESSDTAARAAAFGQIARQARADCERGEDAVRALRERRNRSGQ